MCRMHEHAVKGRLNAATQAHPMCSIENTLPPISNLVSSREHCKVAPSYLMVRREVEVFMFPRTFLTVKYLRSVPLSCCAPVISLCTLHAHIAWWEIHVCVCFLPGSSEFSTV